MQLNPGKLFEVGLEDFAIQREEAATAFAADLDQAGGFELFDVVRECREGDVLGFLQLSTGHAGLASGEVFQHLHTTRLGQSTANQGELFWGERDLPGCHTAIISSSAKAAELTAIALGRPPLVLELEDWHGLARLGDKSAGGFALLTLLIKRLSDSGRSAHFAEREDSHLKGAAVIGDAEPVIWSYLPCRFGRLAV